MGGTGDTPAMVRHAQVALLVAVLAIVATGCRRDGGEETPESSDASPAPAAEQPEDAGRLVIQPARPVESQAARPRTSHDGASVPTPRWQPDLAAALERAREERRPVMAVVYHRGFGGSIEFRRDGLGDPEVGRLAQSFVCVQVEYESAVDTVEELGVVAVPSLVFLRPDGEPYLTLQGYGSAERIARAMRQALAQVGAAEEARDHGAQNS